MTRRIDAQLEFLADSSTRAEKQAQLADLYRRRFERLIDKAHGRVVAVAGEVSRSRRNGGADSPELRRLDRELAQACESLRAIGAASRKSANGPKRTERTETER